MSAFLPQLQLAIQQKNGDFVADCLDIRNSVFSKESRLDSLPHPFSLLFASLHCNAGTVQEHFNAFSNAIS